MIAKRTDKDHVQVSKWFRDLGASVRDTHTIGNGFPDIVVGYKMFNVLVEIKTPKGKLNEKEEKFHKEWKGLAYVVRSKRDVRRLISVLDICN